MDMVLRNDENTSTETASVPRELELIRTVTHELFQDDPVEYLNRLIEVVDDEWRSMRRERLASGATRDDIGETSLSTSVASSRFASFTIGQSLRQSVHRETTLREPLATLETSIGQFTHGAKLAALLLLVSLRDE